MINTRRRHHDTCDGVTTTPTASNALVIFDEEKLGTWMAFGVNTHDLGSFGEETDETTNLHQILEEVLLTERGDGVAGIKRHHRDPSNEEVRDLVTASRCG
ncbi:hypothetical protein Tco_1390640 [Tanacetum coccineum]